MSRVLLAMVFAVGLAGAANAAVMQFSVDGVPVGPGEVVEVLPSDYIVIDLWIELDPGEEFDYFMANVVPTGTWDPLPLMPMDPAIAWMPPFGIGNQLYYPPDAYGPGMPVAGSFSDFVALGSGNASGPVLEWEVHIPDLPVSTQLNLEIVPMDIFGPTVVSYTVPGQGAVPLPLSVLPLELHITPEPATLGLLVLGGLAALRRRFA